MKFTTLISTTGLAQNIKDPNWIVFDCRFYLDNPEKGRKDYLQSHIPGALYLHLGEDLSAEIIVGKTGRHPLPDPEHLRTLLSSKGVGNTTQVVVYDDQGGMIAARLWWLLKWLGHEAVAVLDGGIASWEAEGHPTTHILPTPKTNTFRMDLQPQMVSSVQDILLNFGNPGKLLIDSRAPERYQGEIEPIDPIAGRIPGAVNYFWNQNLGPRGFFEIKDVLRGRCNILFQDISPEDVTFYCGSGVTGAHNVLAVAHSGLGMPKLYVGSWSHWITDPERPITTG